MSLKAVLRIGVLRIGVLLALVTCPVGGQPADLRLQLVATGLADPVAVRHAGDGTGRLFVVERGGLIRVLAGSTVFPLPFLDIRSEINSLSGELGFLGLAFHPNYALNGFFYVSYAHSSPALESVVARYTASPPGADQADPASRVVVLTIPQDFNNHNGGDLHFGPDGFLYIGMGDGGGGGDPLNRAQDLDSLLGKMLRIDVDGATPFAVPPDNPFVGLPGRDEIWARGLRNPWRFSFDRRTGDLLIADVGQDEIEEIDFQPASSTGGENYGWDCQEGSQTYTGENSGSICSGPLVSPILEYGHFNGPIFVGCSVTGGFRYRGHGIVEFDGTYVYADFCTNTMWFASETSPGNWTSEEWNGNTTFNISGFGEDESGELYVVSLAGDVYRFDSPSSIFTDGFESGDTSAW